MAITDNKNIVDLVLNECKLLEDVLNNNLLKTFAKIHNIEPEHSILQLKQEVVASNTFFMDVKKRYGLRIINKEGKSVDEVEIRGMVMRRSEFPSFTKENIQKLVNLLILEDNVSFDKIYSFIQESRIKALELIERRDPSIAGAVSFSKPLSSYKTATGHIRAMLLWNNLEYEYFTHGTKGYLYRIMGVNNINAPDRILRNLDKLTSKNKRIAMPYEESQLPDYYEIDVEAQIEYVWDKRVDEILRCLKPKEKSENIFIFSDDDFE